MILRWSRINGSDAPPKEQQTLFCQRGTPDGSFYTCFYISSPPFCCRCNPHVNHNFTPYQPPRPFETGLLSLLRPMGRVKMSWAHRLGLICCPRLPASKNLLRDRTARLMIRSTCEIPLCVILNLGLALSTYKADRGLVTLSWVSHAHLLTDP